MTSGWPPAPRRRPAVYQHQGKAVAIDRLTAIARQLVPGRHHRFKCIGQLESMQIVQPGGHGKEIRLGKADAADTALLITMAANLTSRSAAHQRSAKILLQGGCQPGQIISRK
jgi:hypothetical protein